MHPSMVVEISCRYGGWGTDRGGVSQQGSQTGGRVSDPKLGLGGGLFHVAYLFLAAPSRHHCAGFLHLLLSNCGAHCGGFSHCRAQGLGPVSFSTLGAQLLWDTGLVALRHVVSSWTRDRTCVSCFDRQVLYY